MAGGVIHTQQASGDVYFLSREGEELIDPSLDVDVKIIEDFPGVTLSDAVEEAKRFAAGAIKKKVEQKTRGFDCCLVVKNIDIKYKVKYGFKTEEILSSELNFKAGDQIVKKGDFGRDFFWIKEGTVEIDKVLYNPGSVFGRAAFSDGIRKKDAFAKTDAAIVAINKEHPDLINRLPVILEKFAQEVEKIKKIRPRAQLDDIEID